MAGATPQIIPKKSQEAILQFHRVCFDMMNEQWNIRYQLENIDRAYMREQDMTIEHLRARTANALGDSTRYQNVTVPIVKPQVEAAVTYQAAVFLSEAQIFGYVTSPETQDVAMAYAAINEENATRGGWKSELIKFFRDGFKYNLCALEVIWDRQVSWAVETDINFSAGRQGIPKEVIWQGNCLRRKDLYNMFWDTRYAPIDVYKNGEFVGYTELMSRIHLKKFINELPDKMVANIREAFEFGLGAAGTSASGIESFYIPQLNPNALLNKDPRRGFDWMAWAGLLERPSGEINYRNLYEVTTLYARIIPQDFGLRVPSANTPQIWKFIVINHQVLIYAERQTNAHNFLPILFGQPADDGLSYQTKSLAMDALPFQQISSALVNSEMAARRRAISDRTLFDPSRVATDHINSDNPSAKIPIRPAGYGKPVQEAVYAFPFRNDQAGQTFSDVQVVMGMSDKLNGMNPVRQGQFVKGNKNNPEFAAVMAGATGPDQLRAMVLQDQVLTPVQHIIKLNILQYQSSGDIFSAQLGQPVKIDPVKLRNTAASFKTTDGLSTADKQIGGDEFNVSLQVIGSSPSIAPAYNIAPMFSYLMKTRNVNLTPFEKSPQQQAYENALNQWQAAAAQIGEIIKGVSMKIEGIKLEQIKELITMMLPPQPVPEQYGYVPGAPASSQGAPNQTPSSSSAPPST